MRKDAANRIGPLEYAAGGILGLLTLLLPVKFAGLAVMPEATSFFPDSWIDYIWITWPAHSFGIAAGAALLLALAAFGSGSEAWRSPAGRTAVLWAFGIPAVSLFGLAACDTIDYAIGEIFHLAGIGAFLWALYLALSRRPEWRTAFIVLLVAGAALTVYAGLRQYFVGFAETREFVEQQQAAGVPVSGVMKAKLEDDRVFGNFTSCNALAGYLVLLLPLVGWALWRAGERFEPAKLSRPLLAGIGAALLALVLVLTRGRGAFLAAMIAAGGFALTLPMRRRFRAMLIAAAVATVIGGALYAHYQGRGFGSVEERVDYLRTSAKMVAERPLLGYGWGGFFYRHMELKTSGTDESAHDPHNIVASFATQAGIPSALLVLGAILYPMTLLGIRILRRRATGFEQAVFWGEAAFFLHALMDIDLQVPANMALSGGMLIAALLSPEPEAAAAKPAVRWAWAIPAVALALAAFCGNRHILHAEIVFDDLQKMLQPQTAADLQQQPTPDRVRRALDTAVAVRPYSPFPWESAGDYFLGIRDFDAAEECYREAQKRTSSRPSVYGRLHRIEKARGNEEAARKLLQEMHRRFPSNPNYRKQLEELYPDAL